MSEPIENNIVDNKQQEEEEEEVEYEELTEEQLKELNELNENSNDNPFGERSVTVESDETLVKSMETLAMTNEKTTASYLIIDTNALISGTRLETLGKELWTIPEVLEEVKDKKTSTFLTSFPFEIKTRQPTHESMVAVSEFSKKTGDYPSLSATDMKLIALTYTFEAQVNGIDHIKTEPEKLQVVTKKPVHKKNNNNNNNNKNNNNNNNNNNNKKENKSESASESNTTTESTTTTTTTTTSTTTTTTATTTTTTTADKPKKKKNKNKNKKSKPISTDNKNIESTTTDSCCDHKHEEKEEEKEVEKEVEKVEKVEEEKESVNNNNTNNNNNNNDNNNNNNTTGKKKRNNKLMVNLEKIEEEVSKENLVDPKEVLRQLKIKQAEEAEERKKNRVIKVEDEGEWITPDNIKNKLSSTYVQEKVHYDVGCITRDFSMQNVILQMGLHLISADGIVIKQVKQFVLKCVACLNITTDMDKIFCGHCGNKALYKATTYVDRNGNQRVSVGSAKQFNLRGTIYSIPKPKGGKKSNDMILTEDQYLHKLRVTGQLYKKKVSKEINMNDLDLGFGHKGPSDDIVIGYGNKNPNVARKRIGKKNKSISIF
ncbi:hypothetical protein ACTFIR_008511 [Dictyostelium discoideum]